MNCPMCGCPVKVGGEGTSHYYIPVSSHYYIPVSSPEVERLVEAAKTMVIDVQGYDAWQRPCYALDQLRAALAPFEEASHE
jgi:hypothetical protein